MENGDRETRGQGDSRNGESGKRGRFNFEVRIAKGEMKNGDTHRAEEQGGGGAEGKRFGQRLKGNNLDPSPARCAIEGEVQARKGETPALR